MKCPYCLSNQSSVIDKRAVAGTGEIRRRRECIKCDRRFTTYERIRQEELYVIKRDGRKELFDRAKLMSGISRALEKRPAFDNLEQVTDRVETKVRVRGKKDISSRTIGQFVLTELKKVDQVSYLRFAAVYRKFENPLDFTKEMASLKPNI